ncbi:UPF0187 protein [Seminavis robusta]|uniref:UPF0187 protein n=1 Tax=Seminavis robusta TaxID=568900 RepID=A0A9N8D8W1_9STRA|nr:UPF0187 protein [Seminavis robusta]|eukprot:Sro41_g025020.1 UPF0187 protein (421) ;mRNA; f:6991-8253
MALPIFTNNTKKMPSPPQSPPPTATSVYHALLTPQRLAALADCDKNLVSYNPQSFLLVFRIRGRRFGMILLPLVALLLWDLAWIFYLIGMEDPLEIAETLQGLESLITPILTPVSFLLVFRLGRAAVRYWDARAAMGKMVEVCRTLASTALMGCRHQQPQCNDDDDMAQEFVRWIAAFPMAVKNFLRPWEGLDCNRRQEIGNILSVPDRVRFLHAKGPNQYAPILVLNELRQLAFQVSDTRQQQHSMLFRQLNEQIDLLTGAWGAMERINGTPLPFVYVVHLRTFLLLYLFLWHMQAIAQSGSWIAILPLQLASWGLLGIEAAAVCCERPFQWDSNHLALGKACIVVSRNLAQTMENFGMTTTRVVPTKAHDNSMAHNQAKVDKLSPTKSSLLLPITEPGGKESNSKSAVPGEEPQDVVA